LSAKMDAAPGDRRRTVAVGVGLFDLHEHAN
jgi:hypothetical protein